MNISFSTVVDYVQNLIPNVKPVAPTENRDADMDVLAYLAIDSFYVTARNGGHYWYYLTNPVNIELARYILRSNGIKPQTHKTHYIFYNKQTVLRVRYSDLKKNENAKQFVDAMMQTDVFDVKHAAVDARMNLIKQRMK